MRLTANEWNAKHPIGTPVRYWPILPPEPWAPPVDRVTRSEAWTLGDGTACVKITGIVGCVSIAHLELRTEDPA